MPPLRGNYDNNIIHVRKRKKQNNKKFNNPVHDDRHS